MLAIVIKNFLAGLDFLPLALESGVVSAQIHGITAAANNLVRAVGYQVGFPDSPNIIPENCILYEVRLGQKSFSTFCIFQPYLATL